MAATTASTAPLTMKLLVESSPLRRRVVFAEAGKDTVDFLFSLLAMPAGTAVKLLGKDSIAGCTGNLYSSAEKLDDAYVHPNAANKDAILCATVPYSPAATAPSSCLLYRLPEPPAPPPAPIPKRLFNCGRSYYYSGCGRYVTEGLEILKASQQSKTVLTDVFVGGKTPPHPSMNTTTWLCSSSGRESLPWSS
ncbi:unnamed protein product [Urochloa humidicola]